jgi:hypothetical protein
MKTKQFDFDEIHNDEQRLIQQVIKNSLVETKRLEIPIPDAPVFYPTLEEFARPLEYITS